MQSAFDKLAHDSSERNALFGRQLAMAHSSVSEMKVSKRNATVIVQLGPARCCLHALVVAACLDNARMVSVIIPGVFITAQDEISTGMHCIRQDARSDLHSFPFSPLFAQDEINTNRIRLDKMQDERAHLMQQQEVLQAELQVALDNYRPRAVIGTGVGRCGSMGEGGIGEGYNRRPEGLHPPGRIIQSRSLIGWDLYLY